MTDGKSPSPAEEARRDVEGCLRPFAVYHCDGKSWIMGVQLPADQVEALIAKLLPVYERAQATEHWRERAATFMTDAENANYLDAECQRLRERAEWAESALEAEAGRIEELGARAERAEADHARYVEWFNESQAKLAAAESACRVKDEALRSLVDHYDDCMCHQNGWCGRRVVAREALAVGKGE